MRHFALALLFLTALPAQSDVMYQCVDDSGHKSFSNVKSTARGDRCTAMDIGPSAPASAPAAAAAKPVTPAGFPKVDDKAQKSRDGDRRRILESELAAEQRNLAQAQAELTEKEQTPEPNERVAPRQVCTTVTGPGGKTSQSCKTVVPGGTNVAKSEERLQPLRDKVALHQRNLEAIQREISKLR